jgi:uncharacterized membrane protein
MRTFLKENAMTTVEVTPSTVNTRPARDNLRILSIGLVVFGLLISGYLSYVKLVEVPTICVADSSIFNCEVVTNSVYSRMAGIPIAYLGFIVNVVILALLLLENRVAILKENGTALVFGVVLFAFLYSVYLVYLQFFVLQALCPWCLSHEAYLTILFIVSIIRLRRSMRGT